MIAAGRTHQRPDGIQLKTLSDIDRPGAATAVFDRYCRVHGRRADAPEPTSEGFGISIDWTGAGSDSRPRFRLYLCLVLGPVPAQRQRRQDQECLVGSGSNLQPNSSHSLRAVASRNFRSAAATGPSMKVYQPDLSHRL